MQLELEHATDGPQHVLLTVIAASNIAIIRLSTLQYTRPTLMRVWLALVFGARHSFYIISDGFGHLHNSSNSAIGLHQEPISIAAVCVVC